MMHHVLIHHQLMCDGQLIYQSSSAFCFSQLKKWHIFVSVREVRSNHGLGPQKFPVGCMLQPIEARNYQGERKRRAKKNALVIPGSYPLQLVTYGEIMRTKTMFWIVHAKAIEEPILWAESWTEI